MSRNPEVSRFPTTPRIGQQLLVHYEQRDAVRHATPLLPSSLKEILSVYRRAGQQPGRAKAGQGVAAQAVCRAG